MKCGRCGAGCRRAAHRLCDDCLVGVVRTTTDACGVPYTVADPGALAVVAHVLTTNEALGDVLPSAS